MPPFVYRITKHDPAHRDEHGHYTGVEDTVSDHGPVEEAYLAAIAAFAEAAGADQLEIREPQIGGFVHFGLEPPVDGYGLADLFPAGPAGFHDGALVPIAVGLELVRSMLRDKGAWCRLDRVLRGEADESFVAAQGGGESKKCQVVAGVALVARAEAVVAGQPGQGALDHPPSASSSFAGLDSFPGDAHPDVLSP